MIEAVRNLHELGVPLERALEAASLVPASVLGPVRLRADRGRGGAPTSSCVDDDLEIERVLVGGETRVAV